MSLAQFWIILTGIFDQIIGGIGQTVGFVFTYPIPPERWLLLGVVFCIGFAALAGKR